MAEIARTQAGREPIAFPAGLKNGCWSDAVQLTEGALPLHRHMHGRGCKRSCGGTLDEEER
jgi:hypothetical protein